MGLGGRRGGETRGREASLGCAPRGPEPQISHRSALRSRVRPGTGRAGVGPAQPGSPGLGATARVPPPPRAPGAAGSTLGDSRGRDPLVRSRAGEKLCKRSLANRKFLLDKVLPLPHAGLQNKTSEPAAQAPSLARHGRRPPLLGPGPGRRSQANRASGRTPRGPRGGRQAATLRGPGGVGRGAERRSPRVSPGSTATERFCGAARGLRVIGSPEGVGGGEAARRRRLGESRCGEPGKAASSAWQSSCGNSMF